MKPTVNRLKKRIICFSILIGLSSAAYSGPLPSIEAQADINHSLSSHLWQDNQVHFNLYGEQIHYRELLENGTVLDSEKGTIPGASLRVSHRFSDYVLALEMHYASGTLRYDGATWGGTPLSFNGQHAIYGTYLQAKRPFRLNENIILSPLLRLGYRDWYRATDANTRPGDYSEEYQNSYLAAGIDFKYLINHSLYLDLSGAVGRIFSATVEANPLGYDETLKLGADWYYTLGARIGFQFNPQWIVSLFGDYSHFGYKKSLPDLQAGVYEPRSKTQDFKYGLGLSYYF
jgi:hypothetical protein